MSYIKKTDGKDTTAPKTKTTKPAKATGDSAEVIDPRRLLRDIRNTVKSMDQVGIGYLVRTYYQIQDFRIAAAARNREQAKAGQGTEFFNYVFSQLEALEDEITKALKVYVMEQPIGAWAMKIPGIGPVLAAGLIAHIDIEHAPTAGHIWSFAGLNPQQEWLGRELATRVVNEIYPKGADFEDADLLLRLANCTMRNIDYYILHGKNDKNKYTRESLIKAASARPWNAELKTLCWKIGESFVLQQNRESDTYGHLFKIRKAEYMAKNENGEYAEEAARILASKKWNKSTEAYKALSAGKLPQAQIHGRAKRYATKIFLSHWQHMAYKYEYNQEPPKPFAISHLGHAHLLEPPNRFFTPLCLEGYRASAPERAKAKADARERLLAEQAKKRKEVRDFED